MKKVAVSIHATENFKLDIIKNLRDLDFIHVDVMDGKFVKTTNLNLGIFKILRKNFDIPILAHLMVLNPLIYIDKIINYIDVFVFHYESDADKNKVINLIKENNKKIGIAINPTTKLLEIVPFLNKVDMILVMSVNPGLSGQKFISESIKKVNSLAELKKDYKFEIDIDGGINLENAKELINTDILSSASSILKANDPNYVIHALKNSDRYGK